MVVGIDTYDHVKELTGAARDAAAVVHWLRRLGVPDQQILLHAAPGQAAKAEIDELGLTCAGCTEPEIWPSFETLMDNQGARLFVFLSGHGFFEPGGERVFLTREASQRVTKNLGIEWYAALLRGQKYARQFLVMDGCLNLPYTDSERARFTAGVQSGVALPPPRADVLQVLCCAASQGERALEDNGRGLFLDTLLQTLDLDHPNPSCVDIDDHSGTLQLDLHRAILDVVAPTVTQRARDLGRMQRPSLQIKSAGPTSRTLPIVEISPARLARVRVTVDPAEAANDIKKLMLWSDDNAWRRELPAPPAQTVHMPHESTLPVDLRIAVRCTAQDVSGWVQPPYQEFVTDHDRDIVFRLESPASPSDDATVVVNTVGPQGDILPAMTSLAYSSVERLLEDVGDGISLVRRETGPVLRARAEHADLMRDVALDIAELINLYTPADVGAVVSGFDAAEVATLLVMRLTRASARRLGGLLENEPVVDVGGTSVSLRRLVDQPVVPVNAGPMTVRVTLPWGSWATRVHVDQGHATKVRLPRAVGVPPLRVKLLGSGEFGEDAPGRTVAAVGRSHLHGWLLDASEARVGTLMPFQGSSNSAWAAPLSLASTDTRPLPRWQAYGAVSYRKRRLMFPLNEYGPVAVQLGRRPRVEPLSLTPSPHWDRLVSSGQLENVLSERDAIRLTNDKWSAPLLGLAGAYACYAQRSDEYLRIVLRNLRSLDAALPDLPILEAAIDRRNDAHSPAVEGRLRAIGAVDAVPVFRWGVGIGVLAAEHYEERHLAERLRDVEQRLIGSSTWTLWHLES